MTTSNLFSVKILCQAAWNPLRDAVISMKLSSVRVGRPPGGGVYRSATDFTGGSPESMINFWPVPELSISKRFQARSVASDMEGNFSIWTTLWPAFSSFLVAVWIARRIGGATGQLEHS